jgi:hypothetical protein
MWRRGDHNETPTELVWLSLGLTLIIFLPGVIFGPRVSEVIASIVFSVIACICLLFFLVCVILTLFDKDDWW